MFGLLNRDTLPANTLEDLDRLTSQLGTYLLTEHNEDGTHNVRPSGLDFIPVGAVIMWGNTAMPDGFLYCNGGAINRTTYTVLFSILGTAYGPGDGSTTFNLPNEPDSFGGLLHIIATGVGITR